MSTSPGTLIELLAMRAHDQPDAPAFEFGRETVTFGSLWAETTKSAGSLRRLGVEAGQRVVLAMGNGTNFFAAFYGVQLAGATAVPVFPGLSPDRIAAMAERSESGTVIVPTAERAAEVARAAGPAADITTVTPANLRHGPAVHRDGPGPDDVAFIQYTSGSTGEPKGVQLSHRNLLTNVQQMITGMEISGDDRFVSWLPVYHDMGLILKTMVPFFIGARLVLLPTSLRVIERWLETITATRATFTAAPDFAYRLCLRHTPDPGAHDLSSLRVALNAAEPVRASTIENFEAAFGLNGVMVAGYGLAEATVGVSMWPPGSPPRVDERGFVSVGPPFPDVTARVDDQGEILIRSTANSRGYFRDPVATAAAFDSAGFVHTGDLGHLDAEGNLYVVGRAKNIIIQAGRNIAPSEIEEIVDAHPAVRLAAAVGIDTGGVQGEQAFVFAEIRKRLSDEDMASLVIEAVSGIHDALGLRPGRVLLVSAGAIPRTHNGKVRHAELTERYLDGSLSESIVFGR